MDKRVFGLLLVMATIVAIILLARSCNDNKQEEVDEVALMIQALEDSLHSVREANGELHSTIKTITTEKTELFLSVKTKDSIIIELQQEVKKYKNKLREHGTVSVLHTTTNLHISDSAVITTGKDTVEIDNLIYLYPEYKYSINQYGDWITGDVTVSADRFLMNFKSRHEYSVVIGEEKKGWFSKAIPFSEVTSKNPYDTTTAFRTYEVRVPKKHIGIKVFTGFSIGIGVGAILWEALRE